MAVPAGETPFQHEKHYSRVILQLAGGEVLFPTGFIMPKPGDYVQIWIIFLHIST